MKLRTIQGQKRHRLIIGGGVMAGIAAVSLVVIIGTSLKAAIQDVAWSVGSGFYTSPSQLYYGGIDGAANRSGGGAGGSHVIRMSTQGTNNLVQLRIYYDTQTSSGKGWVQINASACDFDKGGTLYVDASNSSQVNNASTSRPYSQDVKPPKKVKAYRQKRDYNVQVEVDGNANSSEWDRGNEGGPYWVEREDGDGDLRFSQSAACKSGNYSQEDVPVEQRREDCDNDKQISGGYCKNNGNETYNNVDTGNRVTYAPAGNPISGRIFEPVLRLDPNTGMYIGDITIGIDGTAADVSEGENQRLRFTVNTGNSGGYVAYRQQDGSAGKAFGVNVGGSMGNGTKVVIPFGLPCSRDEGDTKFLNIYDPETQNNTPGFGPSYIKVYYKDDKGNEGQLPASSFNAETALNANIGSDGTIHLVGVNKETSSIAVRMEPHWRYAMVFYNPEDGVYWDDSNNRRVNPPNPSNMVSGGSVQNTISFSVPTDSIGGLLNCNYNLNPTINEIPRYFTGSVKFPLEGKVEKDDPTSIVPPDKNPWQITRIKFNGWPKTEFQGGGYNDSPSVPCNYAKAAVSNIANLLECTEDGINTNAKGNSAPAGWAGDDTVEGVSPGQVICYMTSVQNPTSDPSPVDNSTWRHSGMSCSMSGKQPKVHVTGHDLRVGGDIDTSTTQILLDGDSNNTLFSSWGAYGVFSDGCNTGGKMASGEVTKGGSPVGNMLTVGYHLLTFANTGVGCTGMGTFGGVSISDVDSYSEGDSETDGAVGGVKTISLNSDVAADTKKVYYYPNDTVRIAEDIAYKNKHAAIGEIPRVLIIAKDIVIDSKVKQIDAWLLASGRISTCRQYDTDPAEINNNFSYAKNTARLDESKCANPLTFNGPVVADKIYLLRTAGAGKGEEAKAAETFNLRPDAFLTSYAGATGQPIATTDDIDELPPRF